MKSQDIVILLKLVSLNQENPNDIYHPYNSYTQEQYSVRSLGQSLGISKTAVNDSINRSLNSGLAIRVRNFEHSKTNNKALLDFINYGIKFVFPVKPGPLTRGIPTSFSAPVFENKLMSAGETELVWPYAEGNVKGQSVKPLYKSVPFAVQNDPFLYECLALVDAIRLGSPRERKLARSAISARLLTYA